MFKMLLKIFIIYYSNSFEIKTKMSEEKRVKKLSTKKKFVADGVFNAELNALLQKVLQMEGYSGSEVRATSMCTEIRIKAAKHDELMEKVDYEKPILLTGSPPCNPFSALLRIRRAQRDPAAEAARRQLGEQHWLTAIKFYEKQWREGSY